MIDTEHLTYEVVGTTAIVTMNRPEAKNALSGPMLVGMAPTISGHGYWLASAAGGVYPLGDATFSGALIGLPLNKPVVGIAAGPAPA